MIELMVARQEERFVVVVEFIAKIQLGKYSSQ